MHEDTNITFRNAYLKWTQQQIKPHPKNVTF